VTKKSVDPVFWKGKKVFLTGHTGFKGGWLSLWLDSMGAKVTGYAHDPETKPNFFDLVKLGDRLSDVRGDLNDFEKLSGALQKSDSEILIHMAAQPLVRKSYREPVKTYMDNVMGTISVLEAVRKASSVKTVVVITTDKCYENREWLWPYREDEAMGGYDPYSSSKACAEIATAAWRRSFFENSTNPVKVATVRAGNVVGGGDWSEDRLIPDAVRALTSKSVLKIRNPSSVRPWQHVLDPLHGYLTLAEKLHLKATNISSAYNFGPQDEDSLPVQNVLEVFKSHWGPDFRWEVEASTLNPHEAGLLKLDSSRAKAELGWTPRWKLNETLSHTAEWYRTALVKPAALTDLSLSQISAFMKA